MSRMHDAMWEKCDAAIAERSANPPVPLWVSVVLAVLGVIAVLIVCGVLL